MTVLYGEMSDQARQKTLRAERKRTTDPSTWMAVMSSMAGPSAFSRPISRIGVGGFKSIAKKQEIEIRPLTILAGANSSGKSSMIQPLLLLKQTLEAPYDPGPLLIRGPNVEFTAIKQLFRQAYGTQRSPRLDIELCVEADRVLLEYKPEKIPGFESIKLASQTAWSDEQQTTLSEAYKSEEVIGLFREIPHLKALLGKAEGQNAEPFYVIAAFLLP